MFLIAGITEQKYYDYCRTMKEGLDIAHIAVFIGIPACASMLIALMRGKVLTVSELASESGVTIIRPAFTFQNWIMEYF